MEKDYYKILGIEKTATEAEIKSAYRKLSMKYHPDRHVNDSEADKKAAEEKFKEIAEAYGVLSDKEKRAQYDNPSPFGNFSGADFGGYDPFDIFNMFSGRGGSRSNANSHPKGQDVRLHTTVSLEDLYNSKYKHIKYTRNVRCSACNGEGGTHHTCLECGGSGFTIKRQQTRMGYTEQMTTCHACGGSGKVIEKACDKCGGSGFDKIEEGYDIDLNMLHLDNPDLVYDCGYKGHESKDPKGVDGSLLLKVSVTADGNRYAFGNGNLYEKLTIPYYDALLGTVAEVKLPNGRTIKVDIPECTKDGAQVVSKHNGPLGHDLIECISVTYPEKLSKDDKKILKQIRENNSKK